MKKYLAVLLCMLMVLSLLTGCRKEPETYSSWYSYIEVEDENDSNATSSNDKIKYDSTIPTPKSMTLYKGGMQASVTSKNLRLKAAKEIENLFYDYTHDNLPTVDMEVTRKFIWETRLNETVIELEFDIGYYDKLNILSKIELEKSKRILIPLTGEYAYYLFSGTHTGEYQNKPFKLNGSGLEKIFEGVTLDKKVREWKSTVIAPATVTFYKDGASAVSTDKELNLKIAQTIESWFMYRESLVACKCAGDIDHFIPIKNKETAIELLFESEANFNSAFSSQTYSIFIPLTGEDANQAFHLSFNHPYSWSSPIGIDASILEQYFQSVDLTPLPEEEKKWLSTVIPSYSFSAYEKRKKVGESEKHYTDYLLNHKIMQKIESWFYKKEEINRVDLGFTDTRLNEIKSTSKYLEIKLKSNDYSFFGKTIFAENTKYIVIPLDGDYAYYIFEGDENKNYSYNAIVTEGSGLEEYFEKIKTASQTQE